MNSVWREPTTGSVGGHQVRVSSLGVRTRCSAWAVGALLKGFLQVVSHLDLAAWAILEALLKVLY